MSLEEGVFLTKMMNRTYNIFFLVYIDLFILHLYILIHLLILFLSALAIELFYVMKHFLYNIWLVYIRLTS
ncbi:hypothetical protein COL75_28805 [Bacillus wiedmannii]|nr:hypothetical protein COL75_28805 [Bacillus wiedmannii]